MVIIIGQVQLFSEKNIQALVYFLGKKMNCSITVLLFPIRTYKQKISYASSVYTVYFVRKGGT